MSRTCHNSALNVRQFDCNRRGESKTASSDVRQSRSKEVAQKTDSEREKHSRIQVCVLHIKPNKADSAGISQRRCDVRLTGIRFVPEQFETRQQHSDPFHSCAVQPQNVRDRASRSKHGVTNNSKEVEHDKQRHS